MSKKIKYDKKKADILFSLLIREAGQCFKCTNTYRLQCAHIITRGYFGTRWDIQNAVCLCSGCHVFFTYHPIEWEDFTDEKFGVELRPLLKQRARDYTKSGRKPDYLTICEELEGQLTLPLDK